MCSTNHKRLRLIIFCWKTRNVIWPGWSWGVCMLLDAHAPKRPSPTHTTAPWGDVLATVAIPRVPARVWELVSALFPGSHIQLLAMRPTSTHTCVYILPWRRTAAVPVDTSHSESHNTPMGTLHDRTAIQQKAKTPQPQKNKNKFQWGHLRAKGQPQWKLLCFDLCSMLPTRAHPFF